MNNVTILRRAPDRERYAFIVTSLADTSFWPARRVLYSPVCPSLGLERILSRNGTSRGSELAQGEVNVKTSFWGL
jgi:hypothetical protein